MTTSTDPTRRQVLCGLALALLAPGVLAAACGDGGSGSVGTSGGGGGAGATGAATAGGGGSTGGGATGVLAKVSDVPVGGGVIVRSPNGSPNGLVLLVQPTAGTIKGFDPTCTHQGTTVGTPKGGVITCPSHGSQFSATDGSVRTGPAASPLRPIDVTVNGDSVVLA